MTFNLIAPLSWLFYFLTCSLSLLVFFCLPAQLQFITIKMVSATFNEKADAVKSLPSKPTDDELLQLYGLFKQATIGDNTTQKPGVFDFKGKYKWESWDKLKGTSQQEAEEKYIELVDSLIAKYSA